MAENREKTELIGVEVDLVPEQVRLLEQFRVKDWTRFNVAVPVGSATNPGDGVDPGLLNVLYETDVDVNGRELAAVSIDEEIEARLRGGDAPGPDVSHGPLRVGFEGIIASAVVW
ncbi:hypothetical protein ACWGHM_37415 [Streptomyces sp. NPDC054904]|uniref:hypothetical protein n=1 Tax=unclassified Streptomyces TaxID=2593676 RepID=UPI002481EC24|nr:MULTISPECIES: hypothetical protein [unclassified Streptomyces]MDA5279821.1 hypothetical protein [Streptomyces sp. Isolate_45]MDX2391406.1 hypothetical protein [Streptomyces sp. DK15]